MENSPPSRPNWYQELALAVGHAQTELEEPHYVLIKIMENDVADTGYTTVQAQVMTIDKESWEGNAGKKQEANGVAKHVANGVGIFIVHKKYLHSL